MSVFIPHLPTVFTRAWSGEAPLAIEDGHLKFPNRRAVPLLPVASLQELLLAKAPDGECFVQYGWIEGSPRPSAHPRLSKVAPSAHKGDEAFPTLVLVAIDLDHEAHTPPSDDWHLSVLAKLPEDYRKTVSWYRTPNGMRLLWRPERPVNLSKAQSYLRLFHERLITFGIKTDLATRDWTRVFKLPRLDLELPMDVDLSRPPAPWHPTDEQMEEEAIVRLGTAVDRDLSSLTTLAAGGKSATTKTHLKPLESYDKDLFAALTTGAFAPVVGERHEQFLKAAMKICRAYETNDPLEPFRILKDSFIASGKQLQELKEICDWAAAHYDGAVEEEERERASFLDATAHAMRCRPEEVRKRLIVDTGAEFFVWDEREQTYSRPFTQQRQLLGTMDDLCPVLAGFQVNPSDALRDHSCRASKVVYTYANDRGHFEPESETLFVKVCQQDARLVPKRHPEIEEWLKRLFKAEYLDKALDWLAASPSLTRPVCALYLHGAPSVGKSLFALSLARLWSRECAVTQFSELTASFNSSLIDSPLVWADEKAESAPGNRQQNDSAVIRRLIGNSSFRMNAKFKTPATVEGYPRVLITANNADALNIREDLDTWDIEAIKLRIGYVRANDDVGKWLEARAKELGHASAYDMANRWRVDGHFAQHILWLQATRKINHGRRFLVEGWESPLTQALPTSVGSTGIVVDAIIEAMTNPTPRRFHSIRWFGGNVYVSNPLLASEWEDIMPGERLPGNVGRLKALRSLSAGASKTLDLHVAGASRTQKLYWAIPAESIAQVAEARRLSDAKIILDMAARDSEDVRTIVTEDEEVVFDLRS